MGSAAGQANAAWRCYVKKKQFNLPLNMSPQTRKELNEIRVFCLNNANGRWVQLAKCPPQQTSFNFEVPTEGEFCFTLCMVDKANHVIPPDPSQSEYKMVVVVDTTSPALDVRSISTTTEGYIVEIAVDDAHLDPVKTVFEYQTRNQAWCALAPIPSATNRYCIPVQAAITGTIRITAADLAENVACREINLNQMKNMAMPAPAPGDSVSNRVPVPPPSGEPVPSSVPITPPTYVTPGTVSANSGPITVPSPLPQGPPSSPRMDSIAPIPSVPIEDVSRAQSAGAVVNPPRTMPFGKNVTAGPGPRLNDFPPAETVTVPEGNDSITQRLNTTSPTELAPDVRQTAATNSSINPSTPIVPAIASNPAPSNARPAHPLGAQRKIVNQRHVMIDYRLEQIGASGVGKIEIWITADHSQSWQKLREDVERKSPVAIELPGEGLYGIAMVVSNGRGFGGSPPNPGDVPDIWIEVDMTRPIVDMKNVRPGGSEDPGTVHVTWSAQDRNLPADSVELYFATKREGSWALIAKGLRSDGQYRWAPPLSVGSQVYVRLVARDLAGNATVVETSQPVIVDDLSRLRGRLIGIAPLAGEFHPEANDR